MSYNLLQRSNIQESIQKVAAARANSSRKLYNESNRIANPISEEYKLHHRTCDQKVKNSNPVTEIEIYSNLLKMVLLSCLKEDFSHYSR